MESTKNYLVLHGHFYQPPREDPWTGLVPYQESAAPYHDWNHRITRECYAANAASRILDADGRITDIQNNYEYLSFNFGPTLMWWLKKYSPSVYHKIIEADKISIEKNNGHGNAIAQAYNHPILPLATPEDIKTQIIWGLEDFKYHFGRDSEGLWLPETAVNYPVVDMLIKFGIKYIILSPWQGEAVSDGSHKWRTLEDEPAPYNRAFKIKRPDGDMAVFFYNQTIAHGISFDHYLRDADDLFHKVNHFYNPHSESHLLNIATDGEVYGHHEPFGDMCLAALTRKVRSEGKFEITNYGRYLELYPPTDEAKLRKGEEEKGSAWSCPHGVSRWYKDCGCHTGGGEHWNQKWRTPLRNGFDKLRDEIKRIFHKKTALLSSIDPFEIRNQYIDVLTGKVSIKDFCKQVLDKGNTKENQTMLLQLLEGQKYEMFMFTSCGWFFSEISGIEATQNMKYAYRAIKLYDEFTTAPLLDILLKELSHAKSNIHDFGTGKDIMKSWIIPADRGFEVPAAVFVLTTLLSNSDNHTRKEFGFFTCLEITRDEEKKGDELRISGYITLQDNSTSEKVKLGYLFIENENTGIQLKLDNDLSRVGESHPVHLAALPMFVRTQIMDHFVGGLGSFCGSEENKCFIDSQKALIYSSQMEIPPGRLPMAMAECTANCILDGLLSKSSDILSDDIISRLGRILAFSKRYHLAVDHEAVKDKITHSISFQVDKLKEEISHDQVEYIEKLLVTARQGGIEPDITFAQDHVFELLHSHAADYFEQMDKGDIKGFQKLKYLLHLGEIFGFNVDGLKNKILAF